jgi:hypothetical protein
LPTKYFKYRVFYLAKSVHRSYIAAAVHRVIVVDPVQGYYIVEVVHQVFVAAAVQSFLVATSVPGFYSGTDYELNSVYTTALVISGMYDRNKYSHLKQLKNKIQHKEKSQLLLCFKYV